MLQTSYSRNILLCLFFLSGLGLVQVYSSSYIFAFENYDNGLYFFHRQLLFTLIGFVCFFIVAYIPWRYNRYIGTFFWFIALMSLFLTLVPSLGVRIGGAQRWLQLPVGFRIQPSELLKVSTPFIIAYLAVLKEKWPLQSLLFWMVPLFVAFCPFMIFILQPDFGSLFLITILCVSSLFIMGLRWSYIIMIFVSFLPALYFLLIRQSYRIRRLEGFLNPWDDPTGKGFQMIQSLLGVHSGSLFGAGIGKGQSKLFFLPEAHTDFTLAVLGEELGFFGLTILFSCYGFLIFTAFQVVLKIHDYYQKTIAFGLIFSFSLAIVIHSAVNLGLLPTKGLALPFLSYGGSSLISTFLLFAWFFSIEKNNRF